MSTYFIIELLIDEQSKKTKWWCICIYASSKDIIREEQWKVIERKKNIWGENWVLAGDMNDILSNMKK